MRVSLSRKYLSVAGGDSMMSAISIMESLSRLSTTTQNFRSSDLTLCALNFTSNWLNHVFAWSRQNVYVLMARTAYACARDPADRDVGDRAWVAHLDAWSAGWFLNPVIIVHRATCVGGGVVYGASRLAGGRAWCRHAHVTKKKKMAVPVLRARGV